MAVKKDAEQTINFLLTKYHPAPEAKKVKIPRCSTLPQSVVSEFDCQMLGALN